MIEINNVYKIYNIGMQNQFNALDGVSLTIEQGEMISITGRSGAGKSTLLHIIGCIDNITEGSYILKGTDVGKLSDGKLSKLRNREIGIVLQDYALVQSETALQNVMIPLYFCKCSFKKMKENSLDALSKVGISDLSNRKVNTMSGGQKQRVAIARAIVNKPALILADEPTGALDSKTSDEIMDLLKELNKTGVSVITVTHDENVSKYSDRIITINDGKILDMTECITSKFF